MSAISNLNKSNKYNYKLLCKLYNRYKKAVNIAIKNAKFRPIANAKVNEIESILEKIERYPVSWSYYSKQKLKFSPEFEFMVIFHSE